MVTVTDDGAVPRSGTVTVHERRVGHRVRAGDLPKYAVSTPLRLNRFVPVTVMVWPAAPDAGLSDEMRGPPPGGLEVPGAVVAAGAEVAGGSVAVVWGAVAGAPAGRDVVPGAVVGGEVAPGAVVPPEGPGLGPDPSARTAATAPTTAATITAIATGRPGLPARRPADPAVRDR